MQIHKGKATLLGRTARGMGFNNTTHDQRNTLQDFHCNIANILQCRATLKALVDTPNLISHVFDKERKCARIITKTIYSNVEVKCQKKSLGH